MNVSEREQSAAMENLLLLARPLRRISRILALLLLLWLIWLTLDGPLSLAGRTIGGIAAAAWAYAEWISGRLDLDRTIFGDVSAGKLTFAALDEALGRSDRPIADRCVGARRLLQQLFVATIIMLGTFACALAVSP